MLSLRAKPAQWNAVHHAADHWHQQPWPCVAATSQSLMAACTDDMWGSTFLLRQACTMLVHHLACHGDQPLLGTPYGPHFGVWEP